MLCLRIGEFMKSVKEINKNITKILDDGKTYAQIVYSDDDKTIRLDVGTGLNTPEPDHYHINLNRKEALKMVKLLEEFILHNRK